MKKFKLSRKRKAQYKKDLAIAYFKFYLERGIEFVGKKDSKGLFIVSLLLRRKLKDVGDKEYLENNNWPAWERFYFKRRCDVSIMHQLMNIPDYGDKNPVTGIWKSFDKPVINICTNEQLLEWYRKHYPEDKEAHTYCLQNRNMWCQ